MPRPEGPLVPLVPSDTPPPRAAPEGAVRTQRPSAHVSQLLHSLRAREAHVRSCGLCPSAAAAVAASPACAPLPHAPPPHPAPPDRPACACRYRPPSDDARALAAGLFANPALTPPAFAPARPHADLDDLRVRLADLDDGEKVEACRENFLATYKRSKTVRMEESVRRLFGKQYQVAKRDADGLLGCRHYARACKLKAKCCDLVVACRFCHDEEMGDDHEMDRFATERIVCMRCWKDQPVAARCVDCNAQFAHWFCKHCRFFENTPTKKVYHCDLCNICRLGEGLGIDNFHCHKCDACVSLESKSRHRCIGKALHANCPVCTGYLFTSTEPVVFMRCGHTMHSECFRQYTTRRFQCPLCMHSIVDMKKRFEYIDECVRNEPMPSEFHRKRSRILCNDCGNKCVAKYHFEHHKCDNDRCSSYNTRVLEEFDVPQEHHHSFYHASGEETAETMPHLPRDTVSALRLDEGGPNVVPCSVGAPSHGSTPDPS